MIPSKRFDELINELITTAKPVKGEYFREVELKWGHPDDVISGEGTFRNGNRFVRPGKHAVYASLTEETALAEYNYGQQKTFSRVLREKNAHITYPILIEVDRCVDFRLVSSARFAPLLTEILQPNEHAASQAVGERLVYDGIQAIIYPSAVPGSKGENIVCILDTTPRPQVRVKNGDEILLELEKIGRKRRLRHD